MDDKTKTWEQWQNGIAYLNSMGLSENLPMYVRFKEGDQWPAPTERTKNLPRPVFNLVDMLIRTKRSNVLSQPVTIAYSPAEIMLDDYQRELATGGAKDFTDYGKQLWDNCDQDSLNDEFVDDMATLGTGVLHYYFDSSVSGGAEHRYIGEIRGEVIDPLNIVFANPQQRDEQRQKYIIIAQRVPVDDVKALAKAEGVKSYDIERIVGDSNASAERYSNAVKEMRGEDKVTLLTKYYRKSDGAVYVDKSTESVEIIKSRCLTPDTTAAVTGYKIKRYPIVVGNWYRRKKCIYGIGECQTIIPAQKAVNFLKAMELLSVQQTAWPKLLVKPGALSQPITNEPGEVITDYSANGGIAYLSPPVLTNAASALATSIIDMMRMVSGVNEVMAGEPLGANIAAATVIALQSQNRVPIEEVQKRFWNCIKRVGAVWEELIKAYYNTERSITVDGSEEDSRPFTGTTYTDVGFKLKIDVGASSEYGEVLAQSTLDMMLQNGYITIDQYVELAPHNVVPFAEQFKKLRQEQAEQEAQMQMQMQAEMPIETNEGAMMQPAGMPQMEQAMPQIPQAPTIGV